MNKLYIRITPADAGKTTVTALKAEREQDHPRGCGENVPPSPSETRRRGSPPRMRGKRRHDERTGASRRITPADAGKTNRGVKHLAFCPDHPRGCGENVPVLGIAAKLLGSPPRMRGKPQ